MKYLMMIIVITVSVGCTHSEAFWDIEYRLKQLESDNERNKTRVVWLEYQKVIGEIKPTYPKDIVLIKIQAAKWKDKLDHYNSYECKLICFIIKVYPIPLSENKKYGRLYLVLDQDRGQNRFLQVHNKQLIIVSNQEIDQKWDEESMYKDSLSLTLLHLLN